MKFFNLAFVFAVLLAFHSTLLRAEEQSQTSITADATSATVAHRWTLVPAIALSSMNYSGDLSTRYDFDRKNAAQFSVSARKAMTDRLALSAGLSYLVMGSISTSHFSGFKYRYKDAYVGLPLAANYDAFQFSHGESAVFLKAGLTPAYNVSSTVTFDDGDSENMTDTTKFMLQAAAGIGARLTLDRDFSLELEADYVRSLTNVIQSNANTITSSGLVASAGIGLAL
jgi:hypothetical protein